MSKQIKNKAQIHCAIVGFSMAKNTPKKQLFENGEVKTVDNINPYLMDAPNFFIKPILTPICNVPKMTKGSQSADGGNFILSAEEKDKLLKQEPFVSKWIKPYLGAYEFINNKKRWCLWLKDAPLEELQKSEFVRERIEKVREFRLKSVKHATRRNANTPALFQEIRQPKTQFLVIPEFSSTRRKYIPVCYLNPKTICSNRLFLMPNAQVYHFGILTSNVHMTWVRTVCGRLETRYSYSNTIVYNNFPWPTPTDKQKLAIKKTAQAILDARELYPNWSLAELYNPNTMPKELKEAHKENDRAVMQAYGFDENTAESDIVKELFELYKKYGRSK